MSPCPAVLFLSVPRARGGRGGPGPVTNGASGNIGGFSVGRHAKKEEREGMIYDPSLPPSTSAKVGRSGKFAAGKIGDGWTDADGPADDTLRARTAEARNGGDACR